MVGKISIVDPFVATLPPTRSTFLPKAGMAENNSPPLGKYLASSGRIILFLSFACVHFCEEKVTRDKAVKHLVQFLSHPTHRVLSDDVELAKLWKGIFYCALTRKLPPSTHMLIVPWKKATGCPTSLSSSRPWPQNSQTSSSRSLTPPPPSSSSKVSGKPSSANGTASTVSGGLTQIPSIFVTNASRAGWTSIIC